MDIRLAHIECRTKALRFFNDGEKLEGETSEDYQPPSKKNEKNTDDDEESSTENEAGSDGKREGGTR